MLDNILLILFMLFVTFVGMAIAGDGNQLGVLIAAAPWLILLNKKL